MGRFDDVKKTIDANIRQNGRQEITGRIMNAVLNEMVSATSEESEELNAKVDTNTAELNEKIASSTSVMNQRISETSTTLNTRIDNESAVLTSRIEKETTQLSEKISGESARLDGKIDEEVQKSVKSVPQVLTAAQQLQARKNIGTLSGVTVDLDKLEGVFDDSYTVLEFLQGSDNTAKNKAVCDYIMAQLPSNPTALQILCTRADYPAFELRMTITDDDGAKETVSIFPRLYMVSDTGFAICLLPMSLYSNFLIKDLIPGVEGYIEYVRDYFMATPTNTMPELFICYNCNDGSVIMITPSGAARFQQFKPLYLAEHAGDAGAEYSDADKARGREILGCMADDPITSAELEAILK